MTSRSERKVTMTALEIILLILGVAAFALSFFLPAGEKEADAGTKKLIEQEAKEAVSKEVDGARGRLEDMVEDTVNYAVEKTERSLEKVSNQKIMAVNEYSDTVLEDIGKNHKEVMFLYDMLTDKQKNIQTVVSQAEKTVKELQEGNTDTTGAESAAVGEAQPEFTPLKPKKTARTAKAAKTQKTEKTKKTEEPDIPPAKEESTDGNHNDRVLLLHEQGMSVVEIAKELGLGVGEVKLVIDLFE